LQRKDELLTLKQQELDEIKIQSGKLEAVNELLKLQLQDLIVATNTLRGQCDQILSNLYVLQTKLPIIDKDN
jgi:hypothetical protein